MRISIPIGHNLDDEEEEDFSEDLDEPADDADGFG